MLMPRAQPVFPELSSTIPSLQGGEDRKDESASPGEGGDFFSSLGTERKRKEREERPNPDKVCLLPPTHTYSVNLTLHSSTSAPGKSTRIYVRANPLMTTPLQNPDHLLPADQGPNGV